MKGSSRSRRPTRRVGLVVVAIVVIGGVGVAGWLAKTGKSPALSQALQAVSSAVGVPSGSAEDGAGGDGGGGDASADAGAAAAPRKRQAGPLSSAQLGAPLVNGHFVTACGAPDTMKVTVKATVKWGKAVAVDVQTDPPDPGVRTCVEKFTREQKWDVSPKANTVTVRY